MKNTVQEPEIKTLAARRRQVEGMYAALYQTLAVPYFNEAAEKVALEMTEPKTADNYLTVEAKALQIEGLAHALLNAAYAAHKELIDYLHQQNHDDRVLYAELLN